jgi:hypothetical protein
VGLGKTLTVLATILSSKQSAVDFALSKFSNTPQEENQPVPSKATLILVPSARK